MKRFILAVILFASVLVSSAFSEEVMSVSGIVQSVDLSTSTIVITTYEGKDITIFIEDETTQEKLKARRIKADDDVKVKYVSRDSKNISTSLFKKPKAC
ncbi:MAG: hypothetical protein HY755_02850 [Nitrospirae bacterium]|nr:hypothetical protein [Nitrospirota bacterium]